MRMPPTVTMILIFAAALATGACHSGTSSASGGGATATGTSKAAPARAGGASKADPCSLITIAQIKAVTGQDLVQRQKVKAGNANECSYGDSDQNFSLTVGVFTDPTSADDFATEETNPIVTKVGGWSSPGYIETNNGLLHALSGNTEIMVGISDDRDNPMSSAQQTKEEEQLATDAFAHL